MSKCDIRVEFDKPDRTYYAGERVTGNVVVEVNKDVTCNGLSIAGRWHTHGRGNRDSGEYEKTIVAQGEWKAGARQSHRFEFTAPYSPLTYRGKYINLDHYVRVRVDIPWAIDPKHDEEFLLLPSVGGPIPDPLEIAKQLDHSNVGKAIGAVVAIIFIVAGIPLTLAFGFGLIFIGIGCLILFGLVRKSIAEKKLGQVNVEMPSSVVASGDQIPVTLHLSPGARCSINGVNAKLTCKEVAVSGSGTKKTTHTYQLFEKTVIFSGSSEIQANERTQISGVVKIPEGNAYSFKMGSNSIVWGIELRIDIPKWPDWVDNQPLMFVPTEYLHGAVATSTQNRNLDRPEVEIIDAIVIPDSETTDQHDAWAGEPNQQVTDVEANQEDDIEPAHSLDSSHQLDEPTEPVGTGTSPLLTLVNSLIVADRYNDERDKIISQHLGETFDLAIVIDRISTTYARVDDDRFDGGRTISGSIEGTESKVEIQLPETLNDQLSEHRSGTVWRGSGVVKGWDGLYDRLEMRGL